MNPLVAVIAAFASLKNELYTRFNASLAKLQPLEQAEGSQAVLGVIREVDWAKDRMERVGAELEATLTAAAAKLAGFETKANEPIAELAARLLTAHTEEASAVALAAAIESKVHLLTTEANAALSAAIDKALLQGAADAEVAFNAKLTDIATLAERRTAAIDKLGAVAAAALKDTDLLAENHADLLATLETRVAALTTAGITHETRPLGFASLLAVALDADGTADFDARLGVLTEIVPAVPLTAGAPVVKPVPATLAGTLPATTATPATTRPKTII